MFVLFVFLLRWFDVFVFNNLVLISVCCVCINFSASRNFSTDFGLSGRERKIFKVFWVFWVYLICMWVWGGSFRLLLLFVKVLILLLLFVEVDDLVLSRAFSNECFGDAGVVGLIIIWGNNVFCGVFGVNFLWCSLVLILVVIDFNCLCVFFYCFLSFELCFLDKFFRRSKSCGLYLCCVLSLWSKLFVWFFWCLRMSSCFVFVFCIESVVISGECFCFCR